MVASEPHSYVRFIPKRRYADVFENSLVSPRKASRKIKCRILVTCKIRHLPFFGWHPLRITALAIGLYHESIAKALS